MAVKNAKRVEREKWFANFDAPDYPLKAKYTTPTKPKSTRSGRSNNGARKRKNAWGTYPEPPSPWSRR